MIQKLLHTPDGVRDIYNSECERKLILEKQLRSVLNSYGYRDIEPPTLEYFDVFGNEVGTIPSRELYKLFDRDGETLVLRPDFTPSVARAASKYFMDECRPIRLCYKGNTFVNNSSYQGRLKENTQIGAELIGDATPEADAEIIAMVIETLLKAGLKDFQITLAHVQFFNSLAEDAGMDEAMIEEVKELIQNKNNFSLGKLLSELEINEATKTAIAKLPALFGGKEVLTKASEMTRNMKANEAVARLEEVYEILKIYGLEQYVSFDLGMLSSHMYYTGIVFRGYTYGTGEALVKGGRYDHLLGHFGKDAPSIGFCVVVNQLMNAMARQKIEIQPENSRYLIVYAKEQRAAAVQQAQEYRRQGKCVELVQADPNGKADALENVTAEYAQIIHIK